MANKMSTLCTFMTKVDEANFSELIQAQLPLVRFIDNYVWETPKPVVYDSISDCYGRLNSGVAIINEGIVTLDKYSELWVRPHLGGQGYNGPPLAHGVIQFLHSKKAGYLPDGLCDGRLAASYDPVLDPETDQFVKEIWKIFKKHEIKLYAIDPKTGVLLRNKPETRFFAWPDAVKNYDQVDGYYLTNNTMAYYTSKRY